MMMIMIMMRLALVRKSQKYFCFFFDVAHEFSEQLNCCNIQMFSDFLAALINLCSVKPMIECPLQYWILELKRFIPNEK